jgi:hypothetical protein
MTLERNPSLGKVLAAKTSRSFQGGPALLKDMRDMKSQLVPNSFNYLSSKGVHCAMGRPAGHALPEETILETASRESVSGYQRSLLPSSAKIVL